MGEWILIIALSGVINVSDVQMHRGLTEAQCKQAVKALAPLNTVGAACIGPKGEVFETSEVRR